MKMTIERDINRIGVKYRLYMTSKDKFREIMVKHFIFCGSYEECSAMKSEYEELYKRQAS